MKRFVGVFGICLVALLSSFAAEWVTFQNKEGGFKILFPKTPTESEDKQKSEVGMITTKYFAYQTDKTAYHVIYVDVAGMPVNSNSPKDGLQAFFNSAIENAIKDVNGTVVSQKDITLKGYPGRQIRVTFGEDGIMTAQIYLVNTRTYFVDVACKKGKEGEAGVDKFINSFQLMP